MEKVIREVLTPEVGRSPDELIRQIKAFQHVRSTGEVAPSGSRKQIWQKYGEKIIKTLQARDTKERVKEVRLGLGYTAVQLESGHTGLAFTFRQDLPGGCSVFPGRAGRPASGRAFVLFQFK